MRRRLTDVLVEFVRTLTKSSGSKPAGSKPAKRSKSPTPSTSRSAPSPDVHDPTVQVEYSPAIDGDADPGEVVWTWVSYEDDPTQGKDRPVVVIGRLGSMLAGVALTSKQHDNEEQVEVGTGPWDSEGRSSYAKIERLLRIDHEQVRREGAILSKSHFDRVVAGARRLHGDAFA